MLLIFMPAVVQSLSGVWLFVIPWTAAHQASLSLISRSLLELMSIESVMTSTHLILCCPLFFLPSIFPSIRVFSMSRLFASGNQSIGASASASVLPMSIQSWFPLVLNWFALLAAQETIKSLLQHHSSKTSIPRHSAFSTTIMASFLLIYPPENLQSIYIFFISLFNCYTFL